MKIKEFEHTLIKDDFALGDSFRLDDLQPDYILHSKHCKEVKNEK